MKKPRAKQRDFKSRLKFFGPASKSIRGNPSCLAGYFTWPQVALTHHAFHRCLYPSVCGPVKQRAFRILCWKVFGFLGQPDSRSSNRPMRRFV